MIANPGRNGRPIVSGVIDFGDVTESYIVGDLSIAIVPLFIMEDKPILQQTLVIYGNNVLDLFLEYIIISLYDIIFIFVYILLFNYPYDKECS